MGLEGVSFQSKLRGEEKRNGLTKKAGWKGLFDDRGTGE